ncbi:DNA mismatch repair protein MLH1 [Entomortierella parvispora]|uniref:DNA mismatch repair protein MLH1 n=1 Tax=Entomortierella parvispora TaxID=205924 RepID=A0A9P3H918_9FUNG|nr:DNA mismatch repair protein MLH1 [Entomortierella parvispora]
MADDSVLSDPAAIPTIRRLDEAVVNRIAAGEIIHRPANALKELIENSLDARSTAIQVSIKDGGLKLLQIQDNGHGIKLEDMGIVCERFTTSKLRTFDDLSSMSTYGFRGEALASISHVAHVTITTKTKDSNCAYKASYSDGVIIPAKPGATAEPKPCAGNNGTQISAEDLFYNVPTRRKALKNATEEYNRILSVVNKYAIHNAGVSFTCRKIGSNTPDVHTTNTASVVDNIRQIYGSSVASELLSLEKSFPVFPLNIKGWISNANYSVKKFAFLLFINHRSVDSPAIRKAIEAVYAAYLPKNSHPWVYLALEMDPKNVDVNVHPTKREVHFMNEEEIITTICDAIQDRLGDANVSRNFLTQTLLPQVSVKSKSEEISRKSAPKLYEYDQVRNDSRDQTLDSFLVSNAPYIPAGASNQKRIRLEVESSEDMDAVSQEDETMTVDLEDVDRTMDEDDPMGVQATGSLLSKIGQFKSGSTGKGAGSASQQLHGRLVESSYRASAPKPDQPLSATLKAKAPRIEVKLTSVLQLRDEVKKQGHPVLTPIFSNHTFVGILDNQRGLIQNELALYLIHYEAVSEELFYQICLRDFSNFGSIRLSTPAPVHEMVLMALDDEQVLMEKDEWPEELKPKEEIAQCVTKMLISRKEMLQEYFSVVVTDDGNITAIPMMIKGYVPNLEKLPDFLWRLGSEVDWTSEKACFQTIARELAIFYSTQPDQIEEEDEDEDEADTADPEHEDGEKKKSAQAIEDARFQHMVSTLIFPALKRHFIPPKALIERAGIVVQVAQVKDLYKVFERC